MDDDRACPHHRTLPEGDIGAHEGIGADPHSVTNRDGRLEQWQVRLAWSWVPAQAHRASGDVASDGHASEVVRRSGRRRPPTTGPPSSRFPRYAHPRPRIDVHGASNVRAEESQEERAPGKHWPRAETGRAGWREPRQCERVFRRVSTWRPGGSHECRYQAGSGMFTSVTWTGGHGSRPHSPRSHHGKRQGGSVPFA